MNSSSSGKGRSSGVPSARWSVMVWVKGSVRDEFIIAVLAMTGFGPVRQDWSNTSEVQASGN